MTHRKAPLAALLAGLLLSSAAFAQATAPATPTAPASSASAAGASSASGTADKKAVAKACSDEATKQGLHGKERKAFRSKCKREKMGKM